VLRYLSLRTAPVPAGRIALDLGLPRSTTYHLLHAMAEEAFVVHYPDDQLWGVGVAAWEVGQGFTRQEPLTRLARVPIARLVDGVRLPAHLTATGRAILAALPPAQVRALYPGRDSFVQRTGLGPRSLTELRAVLAATRRRGYAEEDSEVTEGFSSVAVGLRSPSNLAAVALTWRAPLDRDPVVVLEALQQTAGTIEARLR